MKKTKVVLKVTRGRRPGLQRQAARPVSEWVGGKPRKETRRDAASQRTQRPATCACNNNGSIYGLRKNCGSAELTDRRYAFLAWAESRSGLVARTRHLEVHEVRTN